MVLGQDGAEIFAAGVADMDFCPPPAVLQAMADRVAHGVFGYEAVPDGLLPALTDWLKGRQGWHVNPTHILRAPNVLNILAMAACLFTQKGDGIIVQPPDDRRSRPGVDRFGAETRSLNPSRLPLPDDTEASHPKVQELRDLVTWCDGMVWCSPERHGTMTAIMKAQIDWIPLSLDAKKNHLNNRKYGYINPHDNDQPPCPRPCRPRPRCPPVDLSPSGEGR
ncbi:Cystathionine beta-lyase PatB [Thalassovita gelatinovora]|uniref:Cystathionine beta-lyase PatB n=1 Tax=Thalassovita gelatinovora TaxID=53501 RepID=A0A0P1G3D2_THAGE|nr:Cystathionine beta-lyase PatB [Thalassovita gelatinovora]SEP74715.1 NADPH-dependent FMN reductase [Thalassovita gelatinovora]